MKLARGSSLHLLICKIYVMYFVDWTLVFFRNYTCASPDVNLDWTRRAVPSWLLAGGPHRFPATDPGTRLIWFDVGCYASLGSWEARMFWCPLDFPHHMFLIHLHLSHMFSPSVGGEWREHPHVGEHENVTWPDVWAPLLVAWTFVSGGRIGVWNIKMAYCINLGMRRLEWRRVDVWLYLLP